MTETASPFYNILPGAIFNFIWFVWLFNGAWRWIIEKIGDNGEVLVGIFILASWVVGFTLQALWSVSKRWIHLDEHICPQEVKIKRILMAVLWANNKHSLTRNFYHRAALWGHFIIGSLVTIVLLLIKQEWTMAPVWLVIGIISFSFYRYYKIKEIGSAELTFKEEYPEKWDSLKPKTCK